ncbi:MAG: hypothetical protein KDE63_08600 [Novosphingobium sp.]|nr:hypothetical protein [Novosphingobium sp.]
MKKALAEVVLPAVDSGNMAAIEQLQLVIGSLNLLQDQIDYAHWFEIVDGRSMIMLAEKVADASGKPLGGAVDAAIVSVRDVGTRHDVTLTQIREANYALRESMTEAVNGILANANPDLAKTISRIVVDMAEDQTGRERAFVAGTGFDVFPHSLKSIPEALAASPAA